MYTTFPIKKEALENTRASKKYIDILL